MKLHGFLAFFIIIYFLIKAGAPGRPCLLASDPLSGKSQRAKLSSLVYVQLVRISICLGVVYTNRLMFPR